jgi:hypothetical protein
LDTRVQPGFVRKHSRALVLSIALTIAFVWILKRGALPLFPPAGTLAKADGWMVAFAAALLLASMLTKYARYHFLIAPIAELSFVRLMTISSISMAVLTFLPFRLGELARPALLREKGKVSLMAVTGTVGAERIIDGVAFGLALIGGLWLAPPHEPLPTSIGNLPVPVALVPRAAFAATGAFALALVLMVLFVWRRALAKRITERVVGIVSPRIGARVAHSISNLSDGLRFLPSVRYTGPYLLVTAVSIGCHALSIFYGAKAVGLPEMTLAQATVIVGVLALGFALPNAPGFFGAVQLAMYAGLGLYIVPEKCVYEGAALTFLFYVEYLGIIAVLAVLALVREYLVPTAPAHGLPSAESAEP